MGRKENSGAFTLSCTKFKIWEIRIWHHNSTKNTLFYKHMKMEYKISMEYNFSTKPNEKQQYTVFKSYEARWVKDYNK